MTDSYRDLKVGQRAIETSGAVYKLTEKFPKAEVYGLTSQLRRAGIYLMDPLRRVLLMLGLTSG